MLIISCNGKKPEGGSTKDELKEYDVLELQLRSTTTYNKFPVNIQGQQQVEIRPMVDGYIEKIFVDEGAKVTAGQALFKIRAPQYEQEVRSAEADINIAQEAVNMAIMEVEKVRPLVEDKIISAYELRTAQNVLNSRRASLTQANTRLVNARTNSGYTTVVSPVSGVIGLLPLKIGSLVGPSMTNPLTNIANVGNVYAYFSLNEKQLLELGRNIPGVRAQDLLKRLPPVSLVMADGKSYGAYGRIEAASGLLDPETGSINVRATFPNTSSLLNSGSSGTVSIPQDLKEAILIPQHSTYEIQDKKFAYRVDRDGVANSVEIFVKNAEGGKFYIVEKGLKAGDMIVLGGVATLQDKARIKAKKVLADTVYKIN
ncbi:efflux RND transporter periplasmic adaptor subunit [Pedobacter agri]|uniref:efflux RND transporter periplasmic adaptor subunit n=1 Tax=Pedobacter agri TaxID=454586 RepID=UPI00293127D6|nr:efflux RND transporter periplasmic adaptor subunit [Pedobacter agri]